MRENFDMTHARLRRHAFWPLLGFTQVHRRKKSDPAGGYKITSKSRDIRFGSHWDAAVLEWYCKYLSEQYENFLSHQPYHHCVLAYRRGASDNIGQAQSLIRDINCRGNCVAVAMDISGFFDNIDHDVLSSGLRRVLNVSWLDDPDHYIFRRMTGFEWIESSDLKNIVGKNGIAKGRLCTPEQFRDLRKSTPSIIRRNIMGHGIPQGTPLSGLYANISMVEFDERIYNVFHKLGASYRRYSDDIAIVAPPHISRTDIEGFVNKELSLVKLTVNLNKTEISTFSRTSSRECADRPFQYLGFTHDGCHTLIRTSSLNRYYTKMRRGIRAKFIAAKRKGIPPDQVYMRELFRRYTHFGRSRNFPRYAYRAAEILGAPEIRRQLAGHMEKSKQTVRSVRADIYGGP